MRLASLALPGAVLGCSRFLFIRMERGYFLVSVEVRVLVADIFDLAILLGSIENLINWTYLQINVAKKTNSTLIKQVRITSSFDRFLWILNKSQSQVQSPNVEGLNFEEKALLRKWSCFDVDESERNVGSVSVPPVPEIWFIGAFSARVVRLSLERGLSFSLSLSLSLSLATIIVRRRSLSQCYRTRVDRGSSVRIRRVQQRKGLLCASEHHIPGGLTLLFGWVLPVGFGGLAFLIRWCIRWCTISGWCLWLPTSRFFFISSSIL